MNPILSFFIFLLLPYISISAAEHSFQKKDIVTFTPPTGWHVQEINPEFSTVKAQVVGKSTSSYPPVINLCIEENYKGTLKSYIQLIKSKELAKGIELKDLGSIRTEAGSASLTQVDMKKDHYGDIRYMRVILLRNGTIYIVTASALLKEFGNYYKDFFTAMRSLRIIKNPYEMIASNKSKQELEGETDALIKEWKEQLAKKQQESPALSEEELKSSLFEDSTFQTKNWKPFNVMLDQKYEALGPEWKSLFLSNVKEELFSSPKIETSS